jgi:hypothetical protein
MYIKETSGAGEGERKRETGAKRQEKQKDRQTIGLAVVRGGEGIKEEAVKCVRRMENHGKREICTSHRIAVA